MAQFNKTTSMSIRMGIGDLTAVSISPLGYNPSITINMRDNESMEICVEGNGENTNEEFLLFVEMLVNAALKADWNQQYRSGNSYRSDAKRITLEQIAEWKANAEDVQQTLDALDNA